MHRNSLRALLVAILVGGAAPAVSQLSDVPPFRLEDKRLAEVVGAFNEERESRQWGRTKVELKKLLEKTEAQENASLRKKIEELEAETVNVAMHHRAAELYAKFLTDKNAVQVYLQGTLHDTIATLSKRVDVTEARIDRLLEGMAAFKDVD